MRMQLKVYARCSRAVSATRRVLLGKLWGACAGATPGNPNPELGPVVRGAIEVALSSTTPNSEVASALQVRFKACSAGLGLENPSSSPYVMVLEACQL